MNTISKERLKELLEIDASDTSKDDTISLLILATRATIKRYTNRDFYTLTHTEKSVNTGYGVTNIFTNNPINTISSLKIDNKEKLDDIRYYYGITIGLNFGIMPYQLVEISYISTDVDYPEINLAEEFIAKFLYAKYAKVQDGTLRVITQDGTTVYDNNSIPVEAKQILNRYRVRNI